MAELTLTPEMIEAINRVAKRHNNNPETVLRRAIFSYTGKMGVEPQEPEATNVIALHPVDTSDAEGGRE